MGKRVLFCGLRANLINVRYLLQPYECANIKIMFKGIQMYKGNEKPMELSRFDILVGRTNSEKSLEA